MTPAGAIRQVELERYAYGDVDGAEKGAFEGRLADDPGAQARLEALEEADRRARAKLDIATDSARILARLERPETRRRAWWPAAALGGALAAVALVLVPSLGPDPHLTREKGVQPRLEMYVKDHQGIRRAPDGAHLHEGDAIQFRYRADGRRFLFVLSIDARGTISPLYPDIEAESIEIDPDGTHVLAGSVILDDARGPERIYAIFSDLPLAYDDLAGAIEGAHPDAIDVTRLPMLDLGRDDVDQASVLIVKE